MLPCQKDRNQIKIEKRGIPMGFMDNLKATLDHSWNVSVTENGAVGYKTAGSKLIDINFQVSSLRNQSEQEIIHKFSDAFYEDRLLAVKWLFFAGDVRGGLGERRLFRIGLRYLGETQPKLVRALLEWIPEYNRWDSMFCLLDTSLADDVVQIIKTQLEADWNFYIEKQPISLLAKWMPSINASSKETRRLAHRLAEKLSLTDCEYRQMLSKLREHLKVVEVLISRGDWSQIDYSAVPSSANLKYRKAFLRHDKVRREEFLAKLETQEEKIHASVLFPHDIVHQYCIATKWRNGEDAALEGLWKALPDMVNGAGNTICVADGSGSMTASVGGTSVRCIEVANALAIYFAERCSGQFKDNYITFSLTPKLVDLSRAHSLREKLEIAFRHNEVANTNIEAVFELILRTALQNRMKQEELPQNILILSDMEFDSCTVCRSGGSVNRPTKRLFEILKDRYAAEGYVLPRLVFWNICSRTGTIPVRENGLGVSLVSGFSPSIVKMVLSNSVDPYQCLIEQLNRERYDAIEQALREII